ncbi:MAG: acyl carrier protein [Lachnospiraceae bacterium]|nr:acyl carrier protein [Lachnospiraceae bacterium]
MVLESLIKSIAEVLEIEESEITRDSLFVEDLGADSLDIMEIIINLEDEFNIKIPVETAAEIKTVGDAADKIEKAINK